MPETEKLGKLSKWRYKELSSNPIHVERDLLKFEEIVYLEQPLKQEATLSDVNIHDDIDE